MGTSPYTITASGLRFPFTAPKPEHIRLDDIMCGLAQAHRYAGQRVTPINVATHSIATRSIAANMLKEARLPSNPLLELAALLHDAAEAYIGDIISPVREALLSETNLFDVWETRILEALAARIGFDPGLFTSATIRAADKTAAYQEVSVLIETVRAVLSEAKSEDETIVDRSEVLALKPADFGHAHDAWSDMEEIDNTILLSCDMTYRSASIYFVMALESLARRLENDHPAVAANLLEMLGDAATREPLFIRSNRGRISAMMNTHAPVPVEMREKFSHAMGGLGAMVAGQVSSEMSDNEVISHMANLVLSATIEVGSGVAALVRTGIVPEELRREDPALALVQGEIDVKRQSARRMDQGVAAARGRGARRRQ